MPNLPNAIADLHARIDAAAQEAAADFPLINAPDGLTADDVDFTADDAAEILSSFLEGLSYRYRVALARAVNARLFMENR